MTDFGKFFGCELPKSIQEWKKFADANMFKFNKIFKLNYKKYNANIKFQSNDGIIAMLRKDDRIFFVTKFQYMGDKLDFSDVTYRCDIKELTNVGLKEEVKYRHGDFSGGIFAGARLLHTFDNFKDMNRKIKEYLDD